MNPLLRQAHRKLEALLAESQALQAKETLTDEDKARVSTLVAEIKGAREEVEAAKELAGLSAESDQFLNGLQQLNSVSAQVAQAEERQEPAIRGRARHLSSPTAAYRFGLFACAAMLQRPWAVKRCKSMGIPLMTGQNESVNEDGGFLVPEEFDTDMIRLLEAYGIFRQYAKYKPMASDTTTRPRRTGGVTASWVDEGDEPTDTDADWDRVRLTAKKLMVNTRMTSEVNEDSLVNFGDELAFEIAYAFAKKEDQAGFVGDGTSTYGRIVGVAQRLFDVYTASGGVGLKVGAGNAYSELTLADFNATKGLLPDFADSNNTRWFCHRSFFYTVMEKLAMAAGGVTMKEVAAGGPARFLGYDVVFTNAMPKTEANSQVCAILGDLALAADFGERRGLEIAMSDHIHFKSDQIAIRGIERVDINVHDVGNSTLAGPVVGLVTASS